MQTGIAGVKMRQVNVAPGYAFSSKTMIIVHNSSPDRKIVENSEFARAKP